MGRFKTKEREPHSTRTHLTGQGRAVPPPVDDPECTDDKPHETDAPRTELTPPCITKDQELQRSQEGSRQSFLPRSPLEGPPGQDRLSRLSWD